MSFGTGHHATTQLMIQLMKHHSWTNTNVLDLGCGTGILSILASKLGAAKITGIDHEHWAYHNALENIKANNCVNVEIIHGQVEKLKTSRYGMILANINKGIVRDNLQHFVKFLDEKGVIFLSGILAEDAG